MLPGELYEAIMQLDSRPVPGDHGWQTPIPPSIRRYVLRLVNLMCAFGVPPRHQSIHAVQSAGMDYVGRSVTMEVPLHAGDKAEVIVYDEDRVAVITHQHGNHGIQRLEGNDAVLSTIRFLLLALRHSVQATPLATESAQ